jgi:uncharacterized protein YhfF
MKERPILFSGEMVRAILDGRKTQTRRVIKPQPESVRKSVFFESGIETNHGYEIKSPYGQPGDPLWVREAFIYDTNGIYYRADNDFHCAKELGGWRPSIHMPRKASRITLEITDIRVEQVQDISEEDAQQEGARRMNAGDFGMETWRSAFRNLWGSINTKRGYSWDSNPWVWVIGFKRMEKGGE